MAGAERPAPAKRRVAPAVWKVSEMDHVKAELMDALLTMLNLEGPAKAAAKHLAAYAGLDVNAHCLKARRALALAEGRDPKSASNKR